MNSRARRILRMYQSCRLTKEELRTLLEKGVLGHVTGVIGPFIIRYYKGKMIISDRALFIRKSMSRAAIAGRESFRNKVKFAKFLYDIKEVKHAWELADLRGRRVWNRLIKYNSLTGARPGAENTITPPTDNFRAGHICSLTKDFRIDLKSSYDNLIIILVAFNPINKDENEFELFRVDHLTLRLSEDQVLLCKKYRQYIMYSAVIRSNQGKTEWSETAVAEGAFSIEDIEIKKQVAFNIYLYLYCIRIYLIRSFVHKTLINCLRL